VNNDNFLVNIINIILKSWRSATNELHDY